MAMAWIGSPSARETGQQGTGTVAPVPSSGTVGSDDPRLRCSRLRDETEGRVAPARGVEGLNLIRCLCLNYGP